MRRSRITSSTISYPFSEFALVIVSCLLTIPNMVSDISAAWQQSSRNAAARRIHHDTVRYQSCLFAPAVERRGGSPLPQSPEPGKSPSAGAHKTGAPGAIARLGQRDHAAALSLGSCRRDPVPPPATLAPEYQPPACATH